MKKNKVLIVDDEKYVLEMIQLRLEQEGYNVEIASNGIEGIKKAKSFLPDLILMDLIMDGISGVQTIKELKIHEETANIPILVLSGKTLNEDKDSAMNAGATDFISKPILPNRLIHEIQKYME